jgi:hypothetical protein
MVNGLNRAGRRLCGNRICRSQETQNDHESVFALRMAFLPDAVNLI